MPSVGLTGWKAATPMMKSAKEKKMLHMGEDTPSSSQTISSRYNLRRRKQISYCTATQASMRKRKKKVSFRLENTISTAPEKGDHRSSSGFTASSNANARIVMEAAKDKVTSPQVDDRSPKFFSHSNSKPKRNLPSNSRKAALKLPPRSLHFGRLLTKLFRPQLRNHWQF